MWRRHDARRLLQFLVTHRGRWVPRDEVVDALWPDADDPERAAGHLRVVLHALNQVLEPGRPARQEPFFIRRQADAWAFAPSFGAWIDADEFELRSRAATGSDAQASRHEAIALALYRGDYLEDAGTVEWALDERSRLQARWLSLATTAARRALHDGAAPRAAALAEAVVRRDASWEDGWQLAMRAYAAMGERGEAWRAWQRCRQALLNELGMEPLPATRALAEAVRAGVSLPP